MKDSAQSDYIYHLKSPWAEQTHQVWLASTLSLTRNLAQFPFPAKLDSDRLHQTIDLIYEGLKEQPLLQEPKLLHSEQLDPIEREFLHEHFLAPDALYKAHGGEGFVADASGQFLSVINLNNHLQLNYVDMQQDIEKSWNHLIKIEAALGKKVNFSFNNRFGFLTADPNICGTAFQVTLYLHIPAVIHSGELSELLEKEKEEEVTAVGLQGSSTEMIGDIVVAQNICTLGLTEEYILATMRMWATRAVVAEISQRKALMQNDNEQMKNKVTRALGVLTHSYQLETIEALNALSLVKLGVDIGWIGAPSDLNLNQLLFDCRRAHLLNIVGRETSVPDLPKERARYLKQVANTLKLTI